MSDCSPHNLTKRGSVLVSPPGIEPGSEALQATAMTTSAKATKLGCHTGIDPVLPLSQSRVQATTLKTPWFGGSDRIRTCMYPLAFSWFEAKRHTDPLFGTHGWN